MMHFKNVVVLVTMTIKDLFYSNWWQITEEHSGLFMSSKAPWVLLNLRFALNELPQNSVVIHYSLTNIIYCEHRFTLLIKVKVLLLPHNYWIWWNFFGRSASNKQLTQIQYRLHSINNSNEEFQVKSVLVTGWYGWQSMSVYNSGR